MCAQEAARGCGYRHIGATYLVTDTDGLWDQCCRLPFKLLTCKACGTGVHLPRTPQEIVPADFLGNHEPLEDCHCWQHKAYHCPMCLPDTDPGYLMTVGANNYTPASFLDEAHRMGISKRIHQLPRHLELGKTWVYLGHPDGYGKDQPGIFMVFQPKRIEKLVWRSETVATLQELEKKGITPVIIDDGDTDHMPAKPGTKHYHLLIKEVMGERVFNTQALAFKALQAIVKDLREQGHTLPGNLKDGFTDRADGATYSTAKCIDAAHVEAE